MIPTILAEIYNTAELCRQFELEVERRIAAKEIQFPVYLSTGQEYVPATLAHWCEAYGVQDPLLFPQHRAHSIYVSFGPDYVCELIRELLGRKSGCANGMGGSASIQGREFNFFGHDGMLGSQSPIAAGACFASKMRTICFAGDAAVEEDYFLASLGFARTHNLPMLFVVLDNGLSVLTKKEERRSWDIARVAEGFGLFSATCSDNPEELWEAIPKPHTWPALINVGTTRLRWHAGNGCDDPDAFDRHEYVANRLRQLGHFTNTALVAQDIRCQWDLIKAEQK